LNLYYSVSRVLLRLLGEVIFILVGCFITLFTLCPFVTKSGSNFYLDRECIYKPVK
jgi:TRAP-type mannitol/chloroaromatic compound transport system permease small subunit